MLLQYSLRFVCRSSGSRLSTASSTPRQPKAIDIGDLTLTGYTASTPREGITS